MRSIIGGLILFLLSFASYGQLDSVSINMNEPDDYIYRPPIDLNFSLATTPIKLEAPLIQPKLRVNHPLVIDFKPFNSFKSITLTSNVSYTQPFASSYSINSFDEYRLGEKFIMGGNSFSANSVFSPEPLSTDFNDMVIKGASMFLQYEISKKLRISGSINVSNRYDLF